MRAARRGVGRARSDRGTAIVPLEVRRLEQVDDLPWILGAFLAVIGLLGIAYVTLVGVHRRARDLAVLKTIGFRRAQIVTAVATQASILCVVGLVVGIPVGPARRPVGSGTASRSAPGSARPSRRPWS